MATDADTDFLKKLYAKFRDEELPADDELYEPIYEEHPDLKDYDNAELIRRHILFSEIESLTLLSGFAGSGKSTELNRLARALKDQGFITLKVNAKDYLSEGEGLDIVNVLTALAGAFGDALEQQVGIEVLKESYWTRFVHFLTRTKVDLTEFGIGAGAGSKAVGPRADAQIKLAITTSATFRQRIKEKLQVRLGEHIQEIHSFVADCRKRIRDARGADAQIVFIFDQFEQLPGSARGKSGENNIVEETIRLFSNHLSYLAFPHVHTVLTVPSWLKLVLPGTELRLIANLPLWSKGQDRKRRENTYKIVRSIIRRRFEAAEPGSLSRFFGGDPDVESHPLMDALISHSGGHIRDLLRLMKECFTRARSFPITDDIVQQASQVLRTSYLPISVSDARALHRVAQLQTTAHETSEHEDIRRLAQFMNTHMVLYFVNGTEWYDLHPLILGEVKEIVRTADILDAKSAEKRSGCGSAA